MPIDETYDDESDNECSGEYSDGSDSEYWFLSIFFDIDAIFFIQDIWERYFLAFLKISSFLVFLILMPQIWRVINLEKP